MSKLMKNRTDNDIKNKWYSMMRKEKKASESGKQKKQEPKPPQIQADSSSEKDSFDDADSIHENIAYKDLVKVEPEANEVHMKSLSNYAPFPPSNWHMQHPFVGPNVATFDHPRAFVLLSESKGQPHPSGSHGAAMVGGHFVPHFVHGARPPFLFHPHPHEARLGDELCGRPHLVPMPPLNGQPPLFGGYVVPSTMHSGPSFHGSPDDNTENVSAMDVDEDEPEMAWYQRSETDCVPQSSTGGPQDKKVVVKSENGATTTNAETV
jgi:hypothetical protein